ncbi:MAG TPA: amidohydrolase [Thermoanaerobaculia bacterium]|jgi:predicted amidohydrolase YtcJ|nr:amidohydrolase [Thermoanaerobaculia bacterium]
MRRTFLPLSVLLLLFALPSFALPPADTILYHGKVFTADSDHPWAQAVAIRGKRIVAVGNDAPVRALAGPHTRSIDLGGRVLMPGMNDAHIHMGVGFPRLTLPPIDIPGPGPSLAVAVDQVAQAVAVAVPGEWILSFVGENVILDPAATRLALDPVSPNNPVLLITWSSHSGVINGKAMAVAGIGVHDPDPFGGSYGRFSNGTINGIVNEYALFRVIRSIRAVVPDAVLRAQFEGLTAAAAQVGVTSVQEMTIGVTRARSVQILSNADLAIRVRSMCVPLTQNEPCQAPSFDPTDRLTWSGIKWLLDGTPIERSAYLREPYVDFPGIGHFNLTPSQLNQAVHRSLFGLPVRDQLLFHTVGDRALDNLLGALESAAPPFIWQLLRPRIEHGDFLHPEQIDRVENLGAIVVQNPTHLALDFSPAVGPARAAVIQPLHTLLASGVHLAFGSDAGQANPFLDLFLAVIHPFHPAEALTMEEAVTAYTRGSAAAEFQEWQKGSIRPGYLADLAVLSQDIFTIPPPAVPGTTSLLTLVGGDVVWDAGVLH